MIRDWIVADKESCKMAAGLKGKSLAVVFIATGRKGRMERGGIKSIQGA